MWLFFTLLTTLLWGVAELFYKKGSHEDRKYDHLRVLSRVKSAQHASVAQ